MRSPPTHAAVSRRGLVMAALLAAAACKDPDPFATDLAAICNAGGGGDPGLDPHQQRALAMQKLAGSIKTREAARLLVDLMQAAPDARAALLQPALERAGRTRCAALDGLLR